MSVSVTRADFVDALRSRNRAGINRNASRLLDMNAPLKSEWFSVANVLSANGEVALSIAAARRGAEESGGQAEAQFQLANALATVGHHDEALAIASAIPSEQLAGVQRDHFIGTCALELGEFEAACEAFERVVSTIPVAGPAWLSLAALPATDDAALLKRLDNVESAMATARAPDRAQWHYARGAVNDRLGNADRAFADFEAGAAITKVARPYDRTADAVEAEAIATEFDDEAIARVALQVTTDSARPILVIGLPRSGTTLVEQILVSNNAVAGGTEAEFGAILAREIGGRTPAKLESFVSRKGADDLTRLYLHLGDERFGDGSRFVDKNVDNSRNLGVLAAVLPKAPIIWLRRDPLDCGWSCFRTFFNQGIEWSWSLSDIAAHFHAEDRLYEHWQHVLGDRMLTVRYEELVADPGDWTGRILEHARLDAEATSRAHETRRPVLTASVAQVRQPIYQSSVGAADRYRAHLQPFIEAYAATASAD